MGDREGASDEILAREPEGVEERAGNQHLFDDAENVGEGQSGERRSLEAAANKYADHSKPHTWKSSGARSWNKEQKTLPTKWLMAAGSQRCLE
jgi:hypothetical protein